MWNTEVDLFLSTSFRSLSSLFANIQSIFRIFNFFVLNFSLFSLFIMCLVPTKARRGHPIPGTRARGTCEQLSYGCWG